ncbi:MAG: hypothetical protein QUS07_04430, partial [Methanothrix sp.]|nr:hypothetical protein [Methanothrix sp.]
MMIAPQVEAAREQANVTQSTEIAIDVLTKDGALNEESQLIDPYNTKMADSYIVADSYTEENGGFSHSN